jgi:hypothetical protein
VTPLCNFWSLKRSINRYPLRVKTPSGRCFPHRLRMAQQSSISALGQVGSVPELAFYQFGTWAFYDKRVVCESMKILYGNVTDSQGFGFNYRLVIPAGSSSA